MFSRSATAATALVGHAFSVGIYRPCNNKDVSTLGQTERV